MWVKDLRSMNGTYLNNRRIGESEVWVEPGGIVKAGGCNLQLLAMPPLEPQCLVWNDGLVVRLARAIHEQGRFQDMPVLGDALEESGATCDHILKHCRQAADHAPRCWVLDLLLGGCPHRENPAPRACGW